nr:hypothetical protein [Tanacetum cinerariifolium]
HPVVIESRAEELISTLREPISANSLFTLSEIDITLAGGETTAESKIIGCWVDVAWCEKSLVAGLNLYLLVWFSSMSTTKASPKSQMYLDDLEFGVTGFMIVMGNIMHTTARANVAHNFLKLKEGGIYSVKNFSVHPNKDEFRILKNAPFIVEFDKETSVRKASVKSDGFIRYPFELVELKNLEVTKNKYLIDVVRYVTNVGRTVQQRSRTRTLNFYLANSRGQSVRVTLWGGLRDKLIEKRTCHVRLYLVVLTSMSVKLYNSASYVMVMEHMAWQIDYCIMKEEMSILRGRKFVPGMNSSEREMERGYYSAFT